MSKSREMIEKELDLLKTSIDKMGQKQHIEILKLLKNNKDVKLNENRNGVYINMSFLPSESINDLKTYVSYIEEQEKTLDIIEQEKIKLSYSISIE
jgi:hypothetical protein